MSKTHTFFALQWMHTKESTLLLWKHTKENMLFAFAVTAGYEPVVENYPMRTLVTAVGNGATIGQPSTLPKGKKDNYNLRYENTLRGKDHPHTTQQTLKDGSVITVNDYQAQ